MKTINEAMKIIDHIAFTKDNGIFNIEVYEILEKMRKSNLIEMFELFHYYEDNSDILTIKTADGHKWTISYRYV